MGLIDTREGVYQDRSRVLTNKYADIFLPCDVLERAARISITNNLDTAVLRGATVFGGIDIVRGLLHKGADVNARHTDGFTLLMLAACNGDIEIVKLLINQGADVSAVNKDGKTACMLASEKGHKLVAEFIANLARGVRRLDLRQPP
ncbi:MAG: ankyrin repeat domain-containing protein [Verrucomicrobia bacterium]|nr:ankyrin repeat domain-containing protein [Verrucomicrobiota bacterium]